MEIGHQGKELPPTRSSGRCVQLSESNKREETEWGEPNEIGMNVGKPAPLLLMRLIEMS